jgi:hypothetical protein
VKGIQDGALDEKRYRQSLLEALRLEAGEAHLDRDLEEVVEAFRLTLRLLPVCMRKGMKR